MLQLLFVANNCLGINQAVFPASIIYECSTGGGGIVRRGRFAALRYSEYLTESITTSVLIQLIVEKCHFHPKLLHIICDQFIETDLWELRDEKMAVIASLVSQVEKVKFTYENGVPSESVTVPCFFLGAILSHEQPALKTVCIKDCNPEATGEVLLSIAHLLVDPKNTTSEESTAYHGLTQMMVSVRPRHGDRCMSSGTAGTLTQILLNQHSLGSLTISHWNPYHMRRKPSIGFSSLYSFLSNFLGQPQFDTLGLSGMFLPLRVVEEMLYQFLSSSFARVQGLVIGTLNLSSMDGSPDCLPSQVEMSDENLHYKQFSLVEMVVPDAIMTWLLGCRRLRFKTLELHHVEMDADDPFHLILQHPDLGVENFCIADMDVRSTPNSSRDFNLLLEKEHLKKLTITHCNLGTSGCFVYLVQGLQKQVQIKSLRCLNVASNSIGQQLDTDIQLFFDVVFSLPQVEDFELILSNNRLQPRHFVMIHKAWNKRKKKLKNLECIRNNLPEDTFDLEQVAVRLKID